MRKLWVQLTLAFLVVTLLAVLGMALLLTGSVESRFRSYLARTDTFENTSEITQRLETYYGENGTWRGVEAVLPGPNPNPNPGGGPRDGSGSRDGMGEGRAAEMVEGGSGVQYVIYSASGEIVYARNAQQVGQTVPVLRLRRSAAPLYRDNEIIGWIIVVLPGEAVLTVAQREFVRDIRQIALLGAVGSILLALIAGIGIARWVSRPLVRLADAAHNVAGGQLGVTVDQGQLEAAEIRELSTSFNHMSTALAEAEDLRQRMTADVAHELRTPVGVLRAQLQAMMDGVHELSVERIAAAYDQSIHLARLVEDLRTLTQAESGTLQITHAEIAPGDLVQRVGDAFTPLAQDSGLHLEINISSDLPAINGDADRLRQVLANLLSNALRYAPSGEQVRMSANRAGDAVRFEVWNSGSSMTDEEAHRAFDRFWRADAARSRETGGSGLGLAIAAQVVKLHGGRIWAEPGSDGVGFLFEIPGKQSI